MNAKVIIPSVAPGGLNAAVDFRFSRCQVFTLAVIKNGVINEIIIFENPGIHAIRGAGPYVGNYIMKYEPDTIITGFIGPHAYESLRKNGIKILFIKPRKGLRVKDVISEFLDGKLEEFAGPNVEEYYGINSKTG